MTERGELKRRQDAETIELKAQQNADEGLSRLESQVEADDLEREQLWEESSMKLEHGHEIAQMDLARTELVQELLIRQNSY